MILLEFFTEYRNIFMIIFAPLYIEQDDFF